MPQNRKYQGWKGGQGAVDTNKKQGWLGSCVTADLEAGEPHEELTNKGGQGEKRDTWSPQRGEDGPEVRGHRGAERRVGHPLLPFTRRALCSVSSHQEDQSEVSHLFVDASLERLGRED